MMDLLATKDIILILIVAFSAIIFSFVVWDVINNPERYESTFFQFVVSFVLLGVLGVNCGIGYQLYHPVSTTTEEVVYSNDLSYSPKKISSSSIVIVDKQIDGSEKRVILDSKDYSIEESEDNSMHFSKVNEIKTDEFFLLGKKVGTERKVTKSFYKIYLPDKKIE